MGYFLGIDTSNYTTSTALYNEDDNTIIQQKKLLPVKDGSLGLRQSDAVFHHNAQLHSLLKALLDGVDTNKIKAIGVSTQPRRMQGSYMPCFTVGENNAKIISYVLQKPLLTFSHQEGHISAVLFNSNHTNLFNENFLAFHISGGTTDAVLAYGKNDEFVLKQVASSLDLHAGQAIDRVGLMLGLKFPCGAELEKLALNYDGKINAKPTLKGNDCCLSGVENQCKKMLDNNESKEKISAFCINFIEKSISQMTDNLLKIYGQMPVVYAGGVMSNSIIRNNFKKKYNAVFAQPQFSTDNAAGIAYLTYRKYKNVHT